MPKKVYLAIIVLAVLVVASVGAFYALQAPQDAGAAHTSTVKVGVKAGDTFTYNMTGIADLGSDDAIIPDNFKEVNMTDYYRVTITNVEAPIVSYNVTWQFTNGTQYNYSGKANIATGVNSQDFWGIYEANLTQGNLVRSGMPDGATVNETQTKTYLNGDRQTNVLQMQGEFYDTTDLTYSKMYYDYSYVYFDSQTGMLVEFKDIQIYSDPKIMLTVEWNLVDSNVLQVS